MHEHRIAFPSWSQTAVFCQAHFQSCNFDQLASSPFKFGPCGLAGWEGLPTGSGGARHVLFSLSTSACLCDSLAETIGIARPLQAATPVKGIPHGAPAAAATANSSSSLHGRRTFDRAFHAAPSIRHVEVATGIQHAGIAAWQSCQQLQIVKLPPSVISLGEGTFLGCYVLREVAAPGCVQYGRRVFAECCSLGSVGVSHETEDSSVLAPGAQLGKYAFESCLMLTTITFDMDHTNKPRALSEGAFCQRARTELPPKALCSYRSARV